MTTNELSLGVQRIAERLRSNPRGDYPRLFEHLGIQRYEPAHSKLLAWLLNPTQSHRLGDAFLRGFWRQAFSDAPSSFEPVNVSCEEQKESSRPDIIVRGPSGCLIIEVKVWSSEHDDQTVEYAAKWPGAKCIYLTRKGEKARSDDFVSVRWSAVREVLDNCSSVGEAEWLLRQFADHIAKDLED